MGRNLVSVILYLHFPRESEDKSAYSPPRLLLPANRHQNFSGALFNRDLICLDTLDAKDGQWVGFYECHGQGRNQVKKKTVFSLLQFFRLTDGLIEMQDFEFKLACKSNFGGEIAR